ncbi:MAG: hypothetical protein IPP93_08165 [Chitinophagaceae bacterium]|nr:hypothetical protein [Chitinophagaceae bacterium]
MRKYAPIHKWCSFILLLVCLAKSAGGLMLHNSLHDDADNPDFHKSTGHAQLHAVGCGCMDDFFQSAGLTEEPAAVVSPVFCIPATIVLPVSPVQSFHRVSPLRGPPAC